MAKRQRNMNGNEPDENDMWDSDEENEFSTKETMTTNGIRIKSEEQSVASVKPSKSTSATSMSMAASESQNSKSKEVAGGSGQQSSRSGLVRKKSRRKAPGIPINKTNSKIAGKSYSSSANAMRLLKKEKTNDLNRGKTPKAASALKSQSANNRQESLLTVDDMIDKLNIVFYRKTNWKQFSKDQTFCNKASEIISKGDSTGKLRNALNAHVKKANKSSIFIKSIMIPLNEHCEKFVKKIESSVKLSELPHFSSYTPSKKGGKFEKGKIEEQKDNTVVLGS